MDSVIYKGYKGDALAKLKELNVRVWSDVVIKTTKGKFIGVILPRSETGDDQHIVVKLRNGYNIGLAINSILDVTETAYREIVYKIPEKEFPYDKAKPNVTLLGTGGTIASRLDYRTGAVIPAFTPGELYGAVPELADICNMKTEKICGIFSENMGPEQWRLIAEAIGREIKNGVSGIIIGHGTDTMHHTGAALTFMVQHSPVPIVMVGSQRSSDRPSSDAARNLQAAAWTAAYGDIAQVMVCMFGPTSDQYNLLHSACRVRKMHSSYRSTFRTIGGVPLAMVEPGKLTHIRSFYKKRRTDREVTIDTDFESKVAMIYYYPNMQPDIIEALIDNGYKGIVIAGTGLGHVNKPLYVPIKKAIDKGIAVFMTVQTLWGYVNMYVYDTGRDLMHMGIVPAANMLPEVAYVKLGWVLGHATTLEAVKKMMLTPFCDEITPREPFDGYMIMQGGIPEVEKFIGSLKL